MRHLEHDQQVRLFNWARSRELECPALKYLFAVPMGGQRNKITAARLKAEGAKAGCPDVWLPCVDAAHSFHGLVIEMKVGRNRPTVAQQDWLTWLTAQDYRAEVCFSWVQAAQVICEYLALPSDMLPLEEM